MAARIKTDDLPSGGEFDFYGRRYAVYGSKITFFSVSGEDAQEVSTISPPGKLKITCLAWCHPMHGPYIAGGCGNLVCIWKESSLNLWEQVLSYSEHTGKITSVSWSPAHLGLNLLASSEDQCFSLINNVYEDNWHHCKRKAHNESLVSASWLNCPDKKCFVTAAENVKVWKNINGEFDIEFTVEQRFADVRACTQGMLFAACDREGVFLWKKSDGEWRSEHVEASGWMVQWSVYGNVLLVSSQECIYVIRQTPNLNWIVAQTIASDGRIHI